MPAPTGQRTKRGSLAPTDISEVKQTSPRKEPPFKDPPSDPPSGADIEAPANSGDSEHDDKDEPTNEVEQKEDTGAADGSHKYTKLPTTDDTMLKVEDANEAVKSKFHHGKDAFSSAGLVASFLPSHSVDRNFPTQWTTGPYQSLSTRFELFGATSRDLTF